MHFPPSFYATLVGAAALCALWPGAAHAQRATVYVCENGTEFSARFSSASALTVTFKGRRIALKQKPAAEGILYAGRGYGFLEKGREVVFTRPGAAPTTCRSGPAGQRAGEPSSGSVTGTAERGPSFECSGDLTSVERAICGSSRLAALDGRMATAYRQLRDTLNRSGQRRLRDNQLRWLKRRNACRSNRGCLTQRYNRRIAGLKLRLSSAFGRVEQPVNTGLNPGCGTQDGLRSGDSRVATTISFRNLSQREVLLYWITYRGRKRFHGRLAAGRRLDQPTFATHPWLITDRSGACLGVYLPEPRTGGRRTVVIR